MPFYEFKCAEGHVTEKLASRTTEIISCPCGAVARRAEVNYIGFTGFAPTPASARTYDKPYRQFIEAQSEIAYKADRFESQINQPADVPNLHRAGLKQAQALQSKGVTTSEEIR